MRFPFDQPTLTNRLQALQIALLRSSVTRRRIASPESRTVQEFGQELWTALFAGDVLSRYEASRQEAKHQEAGVRIKFRCDDPQLASLPWEYLFDPIRGDFVALSAGTPLVRYIPLPESMPPLRVTPPIRILAIGVSPSDLDGLDIERERSRLTAALAPLQGKGIVELEWIPGQTWSDMQEALWQGPWHILHFVGHGGFDENRQEGIVAFARPDGKADYKRATSVGRVLGDHEPLRLAVLNACESGRTDATDLFSSTAGTLVRKGTPAVVAMQYEITDDAAIELSRSFYGAVARGIPVDTALTEARKGLATSFEDTLEWGTPVLYLQAPDGVLFDIAAAPAVVPAVAAAAAIAVPVATAPPVAPPVETPPVEAPPPEPPTPEPVRTTETPEPERPPPEPPIAVPPPPPPRRPPIAILAAGGGAAVLGIVLVANILGGGGGGGAGESASPAGSGSAAASEAASGASSDASPSTAISPSGTLSSDAPPSLSADLLASGRGILFQSFPGTSANTFSGESEIYLIEPDGAGLQRITTNTIADRFPRWSPDGTFFAFSRFDGLAGDILTIDTAGIEGSLTSGGEDDRSPEVARGFVYFNRRPATGGTYDIWRVPVQAGDPQRAVGRPNVDDLSPAWSPDGKVLAFTSDRDDVAGRAIYITPPGGPAERLTTGETVDRNPRWHPTEDRIVFTRNTVEDGRRDIWSIDLDTREATPITSDPADEGAPVYSPDGERIAFYRSIDDVFHLIVRVLASGEETDLTETRSLEGNSLDPSWR